MDAKVESINVRKMNYQKSYLKNIDCNMKSMFMTLICVLYLFSAASAQSERKLVRDGNEMYKNKKYSDAEVNYKKSLGVNKDSKSAIFNLGDAYYKQGKFEDATKQFEGISSDKNLDKETQSKAFHNLGNSYLQSKKYNESINAYKNALKLNPKDNDTRYNLAYAQSKLQQQQQQQQKQDQNKDQKDQKDQKDKKDQKDQKDQKKDEQQQQKEQQQKQDQQKDEEKQAKKRDKISKEDAEKILQALNNDEKNTQKKLTKKDATKISINKKW